MLPITVIKSPADAALTVDGQAKNCSANCDMQLAPGNHTIALERPGYAALHSSLTLASTDAHRVVTLALEPAIGAAPPAPLTKPAIVGTVVRPIGGTPLTVNPALFMTQPTCSFANSQGSGTSMWAVPVTYTAPSPTVVSASTVLGPISAPGAMAT